MTTIRISVARDLMAAYAGTGLVRAAVRVRRLGGWRAFATTARAPTVLFCGEDFRHWIESIRELQPTWQCFAVPRADVHAALSSRTIDVAVPLMTKLSRADIMVGKRNGLRLIQQFGAGLEGVDLAAAAELDVPVCNIPTLLSGNAVSTAEHAIHLLLSLLRRPQEMDAVLRARVLGSPLGATVHGKRVLVVGFGALGKQTAMLLRAFGPASVSGFRDGAWTEKELALVDEAGSFSTATRHSASTGRTRLLEMASNSDVAIMCCPLNKNTKGIFGMDVMSAMPPGAFVVNVARGGVIDREALVHMLQTRHMAGAAMDVWWQEPFDADDEDQGGVAHMRALQAEGLNVVLTPHVGGVTELSRAKMSRVFVDNVVRVLGC